MKNKFTLILTLCSALAFGQTTENDYSETNLMLVQHEKNPGVSFLLSTLVPGTGQMYNGQVSSGLIIFFSEGFLFSLYNVEFDDYQFEDNMNIISGIAFLGVYIYQIIDAPLYAKKWNAKNGFLTLGNADVNFACNPINKSLMVKVGF